MVPNVSVIEDDDEDKIKGDGGQDLYYGKDSGSNDDKIKGLKNDETLEELG